MKNKPLSSRMGWQILSSFTSSIWSEKSFREGFASVLTPRWARGILEEPALTGWGVRKVLILADTLEKTLPYGLRMLEADFDRRRLFFVSFASFCSSSTGRDGAANLIPTLKLNPCKRYLRSTERRNIWNPREFWLRRYVDTGTLRISKAHCWSKLAPLCRSRSVSLKKLIIKVSI